MKNSKKVTGILLVLAVVLLPCILYVTWKVQKSISVSHVAVSNPQVVPINAGACPHLFISWNLKDMGRSKTAKEIEIMAKVLKDADVVAVQEINAGSGFGAQAVYKLADELSRKGSGWDYVVSNPTQPKSPGVERYAYLIKKSTVSFNQHDAHLVKELEERIDREPFSFVASIGGQSPIRFFTIHTVPTKKGPAYEVEQLLYSHTVKSASRAIFSGDFNLGEESTNQTFAHMGYDGAIHQKTSLRQKYSASRPYVLHQYDNIYTKGVTVCESGVLDFVAEYFSPVTDQSLQEARKVSDHLPVYVRFK